MAQRRMFSKKITETDQFLDMPMSAQCLYFHLNMSADDDGFIRNVKTIKRMIGASDDDLKLILSKEFIIPFDTGVVVIKDWKIHNYIRSDRYTETVYKHEKSQLTTDENNAYQLGMTSGIPNGYQMDTQVRLELGKDRIEIEKDIEKNNKSQSPRRYGDDSPYLKMAQYLFNWIKQNNPSAKEPNYQKWADDFRKLSEIDKRSKKDIKQIIDWSQKDNFWQTNILSPAKLRKHFDKLTMQKNAKPSKRNSFQEVEPSWLNQEKTGLQDVEAEKAHNNTIEEIEAEFDDISADIQARINRLYGDDDN